MKTLQKSEAERVAASAKDKMVEILEELGEKAIRLAKHAGRKTVTGKDIKEAAR